jgi:hypothetical protein
MKSHGCSLFDDGARPAASNKLSSFILSIGSEEKE